ncbi:hypothetical protein FN846DRAFT_999690 [Sphaerosporella brunnea]|uniref:Uncharacterized protein n=1 Tax=Sphaerosporella brunnea TaxID=1250544 RepID=A0A5J5EHK3_9PEZI|nr:hypothetical protein FN846DRAFT_999690 [Sphaerosporella brunnea]
MSNENKTNRLSCPSGKRRRLNNSNGKRIFRPLPCEPNDIPSKGQRPGESGGGGGDGGISENRRPKLYKPETTAVRGKENQEQQQSGWSWTTGFGKLTSVEKEASQRVEEDSEKEPPSIGSQYSHDTPSSSSNHHQQQQPDSSSPQPQPTELLLQRITSLIAAVKDKWELKKRMSSSFEWRPYVPPEEQTEYERNRGWDDEFEYAQRSWFEYLQERAREQEAVLEKLRPGLACVEKAVDEMLAEVWRNW